MLPGAETGKLFEGIKSVATFPLTWYLHKGSEMVLPVGGPRLKVNSTRKLYHTALCCITDREAVLSLLSKADAHSKRIAGSVCATKTARCSFFDAKSTCFFLRPGPVA